MNDCEVVCAGTKEDAIKFYRQYDDYSYEVEDIKELDPETEYMWYNFNFDAPEYIKILLDRNKKTEYKIKKDFTGDFDAMIYIPYKAVIEFDDITNPYIISSIEF